MNHFCRLFLNSFSSYTMVLTNRPESAPRSRFKVHFLKSARDTFVQNLSNFECRKIPEEVRTRLEHRFSILEISKNIFFRTKKISETFFFGQKFHGAKKQVWRSLNAFLGRKHSSKWKMVPFDQVKIVLKQNRRSFPQSLRKLISSTGSKSPAMPKNAKDGTLWVFYHLVGRKKQNPQ